MKKVRKYEMAGNLPIVTDFKFLPPISNKWQLLSLLSTLNLDSSWKLSFVPPLKPITLDISKESTRKLLELEKKINFGDNKQVIKNPSLTDLLTSQGISVATDYLSKSVSDNLFDDSEFGRNMGTIFSSGISSAGNTMANNLIKGAALTEGLGKNIRGSIGGAVGGIAANYAGQGITNLMNNSKLGKFTGAAVSSAGGQVLGGILSGGSINIGNPYGFGALVLGSALGAMNGPSKEYSGKYGRVTQTMDSVYDGITAAVNVIPGWGLFASGMMTLNKGLSNIFGSTDGMTKTDAILGSAFMPAPVKWLNMAGANTTSKFGNLSWLNTLKTNSFMGNAFGNLGDKFNLAREESGKTYGTFSLGAYDDALRNLEFSNYAWNKVLAMADLNELLNIRSQYMSSINNLRYALLIQGGWSPLARGKYGMKIFNNATDHNIGMRLLSGAALIDNKQIILCSAID